jgi:hypothetical protein
MSLTALGLSELDGNSLEYRFCQTKPQASPGVTVFFKEMRGPAKSYKKVNMAAMSIPRLHEQTLFSADPIESAKSARLRYVSDVMVGIRRKRAGRHFTYIDTGGKS